MNWFEELTGISERSPDYVRQHLVVEDNRLRSLANNRQWQCGTLEMPSLLDLRERVHPISSNRSSIKIQEIVAGAQDLHCSGENSGAMFQVASQFNLLEMVHPDVTPEQGVGIYENDFTQGPACAISAGAGTIFRNYFANVNGEIGQTAKNQLNGIADIDLQLKNNEKHLWKMINGYVMPSREGLEEINSHLNSLSDLATDQLRGALRIGVHRDTQVTIRNCSHLVSQCYCSAMPVAYTGHSSYAWEPFAKLILEAAYEATILAAIENAEKTNNNRLFLTLLGGGAFGNTPQWIFGAISRAILAYPDCGLYVSIVSYGRSDPSVKELARELTQKIHDSPN